MQALQRDGFTLIAPLRNDTKPRAVWPEGLTHLPTAPLVLEGEEDEAEEFVDTTRELAAKERYYAERYGDDDGPAPDIPGFEGLAFPSIRVKP
jgi:hypothetical protein